MNNIIKVINNQGMFYLELNSKLNQLQDTSLITGSKINNPELLEKMSILNFVGKKEIPVWVRLVGSSKILRDMSEELNNKNLFIISVPNKVQVVSKNGTDKLLLEFNCTELIIGCQNELSTYSDYSGRKSEVVEPQEPELVDLEEEVIPEKVKIEDDFKSVSKDSTSVPKGDNDEGWDISFDDF